MAKNKKTKAQLDAEHRALRVDRLSRIAETAIKYGALVFVAWLGTDAVRALAGQTTLAQIGVGVAVVGNMEIVGTVQVGVTAAAIFYGLRQRQLRRKTIEELSPYVRRYESLIDRNRSSSRLEPGGTTRREDRNA